MRGCCRLVTYLFVLALLLSILWLIPGCGNSPAPVDVSERVVFPATWTPPPSPTPGPPTATATRVISGSSVRAGTPAAAWRRLPASINNGIGLWASTSNLTLEQATAMNPAVQLVTGPYGVALRRSRSRLIDLLMVDGKQGTQQALKSISTADRADAVLVEHAGEEADGQPLASADNMLTALRQAIGGRLLFASTYAWADGAGYADHAKDAEQLIPKVDGICICDFLRTENTELDTFKIAAEWKKDVDALNRLSSTNKFVLVATRIGKVPAGSSLAVDQWFNYSLASFLLGANGQTVYYSYQGPSADDYMSNPAVNTLLGAPYGPYSVKRGLYLRQFARGLVVVNPGSVTVDFALSRPYYTPSGQVFTRLEMQPHTGLILKSGQ